MKGMNSYLNKRTIQPHSLKLNALSLYIDIQRTISGTDRAVALYDPALGIVKGRRECDRVTHELAVAGRLVLIGGDGQHRVSLRKMLRGVIVNRKSEYCVE
jgi:hypothetical protein